MSCGLKNVCLTSALPGASRKIATSAASTTSVLAVEMTVARRPPPDNSRGPRPVALNEPGICAGPRPPSIGSRPVKSVPPRTSGWLSSIL